MSSNFLHSMRSLRKDGSRGRVWAQLAVVVLLMTWLAWFFLARVGVYETSISARLEVSGAAHPIQTQVSGRVVMSHLVIGRQVQAGEVLVELDAVAERLQLQEGQTEPVALGPQIEALRNQAASEKQALDEDRKAAATALAQARTRVLEAEASARYAAIEAKRLKPIQASGVISELELLRAEAEAQKQEAAAEGMRLAVGRQDQEQRTSEKDREAHLAQIKSEITRLEGQLMTGTATVKRLEHQVEKRRILAPVTGWLGEVADVPVGSFVNEGSKLGVVVPDEQLKITADFIPSSALGRIQPGQIARMRFDGFPSSQFGSLAAIVVRVSSEPRDGYIRVELYVRSSPRSSIPLQHGLPGTVEIEVERSSPALLALRSAGKLFTTPTSKDISK